MNKFDQNIKKKLYNAELPVSDSVWATIESQINVKEEKPKYWMFFLLLAFAVPFLIQNSIKDSDNKVAEAKANHSTLSKAQQAASLAIGNQSSNRLNGNAISENKISNAHFQKSTSGNSGDISASEILNNGNLGSANSPNEQSNIFENVSLSSLSSNPKKSNRKSLSLMSDDKKSKSRNLSNLSGNSSSVSGTEISQELIILPRSTKKLKFLTDPFRTQQSITRRKGALQLIEESRVIESLKLGSLTPLTLDNSTNTQSIIIWSGDRHDNILSKMLLGANSAPTCPHFGKLSSGLYIYADYSLGLVNQMLSTQDGDYSNLVSDREASESGALSFSMNVGLGKQWRSGFLIESGINYDKINTNFESTEDIVRNTTTIRMDTIYTGQGIKVVSDTVITSTSSRPSSMNSFRQINLPVIAGYELPIYERFSLVAKGGVLVNLSSSNSGIIEDNSGLRHYNSDDRATSIYKTNLSVSYVANINLVSNLSNDLSAYMGVRINHYPNNFSLREYPIKQTYTKYGLSAGLRYNL